MDAGTREGSWDCSLISTAILLISGSSEKAYKNTSLMVAMPSVLVVLVCAPPTPNYIRIDMYTVRNDWDAYHKHLKYWQRPIWHNKPEHF
jgi:hypothetical protein